MDGNLLYFLLGVIVLFFILLIGKSFVWWYFGIYELLDRFDKNNNLLTDIREILKKSTGVNIVESNIKNKY